ncbi:hypothetical protein TRVA0_006S03422 [Trichomonascus vanleenenianus]|uniref:uncharacterized protein n=1 Tax=Trichomonascus vanleenenianus TaxID=2268995 RepID=UPI003EC9BD39
MPARKKKAAAAAKPRAKTARKQVASPMSSPQTKRIARVDLGDEDNELGHVSTTMKKPQKPLDKSGGTDTGKRRGRTKANEPESDDGFVFTRNAARPSNPEKKRSKTARREPTPPSSPPLTNYNDSNERSHATNNTTTTTTTTTTTNGNHHHNYTTSNERGTPQHSNGTTTRIALPISDTPVIRRNQEMRANPAARRRSSLGSRGKRVSSIGNGFVAVPHEEVDPRDFFKHVDPDIPEPHRMKQILLWCAKRVLDARAEELRQLIETKNQSSKAVMEQVTGLRIAQVIEQELVRDLTNGKINTSWWSRPESTTAAAHKTLMPNAQNVANMNNLEAFEKKLRDLTAEKEQWMAKLEAADSAARTAASEPHNNQEEEDWSLVDESTKPVYDGVLERTRNDICAQADQFMRSIEPRVDALSDSVHRINAIVQASELFTASTMNKLVSQQPQPQPIVTRDLLRTLSRLADSTSNVY